MIEQRTRRYPGRQYPSWPTALYWSDRVHGWWPGLPTACPVCLGGRLDAEPPDGRGPGRVYCLSCGREVQGVAVLDAAPWRPPTAAEFAAMPRNPIRRPSAVYGSRPDPDAAPARVVRALEGGASVSIDDLCHVLQVEAASVRVAIHMARKRGANIVCRGGRYVMEGRQP